MTQEKKKIIPESELLSSEKKEDEEEEDISIDNIEEYNSTFLDPNSEEIEYELEMAKLLNTIDEEGANIIK